MTAVVNGHPRIVEKLRLLPCCLVWQSNEQEMFTALFDVADLSQVVTILVPKWQPVLSDNQLIALAERRRGRRK